MKCPKCGVKSITQSQGMCQECRWVYEQEQLKKHKNIGGTLDDFLKNQGIDVEEMEKRAIQRVAEESVSLDDFIAEEMEGLKKFKEHWLKKHKESPEMYPMNFPADDAGLWWEMYFNFSDEGE